MVNVKRKKSPKDWFKHEKNARASLAAPIQQSNITANLPSSYSSYFSPFSNFVRDIEQMFENTLDMMSAFSNFGLPSVTTPWAFGMQSPFQPTINIASNDNEYTIFVEVPGMEEKDVQLNVSDNGVLTISGEKKQENAEERGNIQYAESSYGAFERTLSLPDDVKQEAIQARFKNGLLTITCPRMEAARTGFRQIPINATGKIESARTAEQSSKKAA